MLKYNHDDIEDDQIILKRPANLWTLYLSSHRGSGVPLATESHRLRSLYKELTADSPEMIRLKELYNANKEAYQLKKKGLGTSEKLLLKGCTVRPENQTQV